MASEKGFSKNTLESYGRDSSIGRPLIIAAVITFISSFASLILVRGKHFSWWVFLLIAVAVWVGIKS